MSGLAKLNQLEDVEAQSELLRCCGSREWAKQMSAARPFDDLSALYAAANRIWSNLPRESWLEAFSHHPRIGEKQLREKFGSTAGWAEQEQKGASGSSEQTLSELARGNQDYEQRFGFVFLVCATGKSAEEMLALLKQRIHNTAATELLVAAAEQAKITRLRLEKWIIS